MPKLPSITPKKLITFLETNGFLKDHATGSHFVFFNPDTKRRAVVPYHTKDLPKGTLLSILREAGFSRDEFLEYLNS